MQESNVLQLIGDLVAEEHALLEKAEKDRLQPSDHERLEEVQVALDRYWDLLRQRRARSEFGRDPDQAHVRPTKTVEGYVQ